MVAKLKLALRNPILPLAYKPIVYAGTLSLVWWSSYNPLAVALFLVANFLMYIHPLLNSNVFLVSFLILISLTFVSLATFAANHLLVAVSIISSTILVWLVWGLKNLYFINRSYWYYLLNLGIWYWLFLLVFFRSESLFFLKLGGLAVVGFFLFREFLKIISGSVSRQNNLYAVLVAMMAAEIAWIISWLPIGGLMMVNFSFLGIYAVTTAIALRQEEGGWTNARALRYASVMTALLILSVLTARWYQR